MRFDFLNSQRPVLLQRLLEFRIPERLRCALCALAAALAVICGACVIEAYRLREAIRVEAVYRARWNQAELALKQTHVYYNEVRSLVELDRRVQRIESSGNANARTLAEIADDLPAHAWLTGISRDAGGLTLSGQARSLSVLSGVMHGLMRATRLRNPALVNAVADKEMNRGITMKYEIHVEDAAP